MTQTTARTATRDPVLTVLLGVAAIIVLCYLLPVGGGWYRLLAFWPIQIALDVTLMVGVLRVVRVPDIPATTRRFWRSMAGAASLFTLADSIQAAQKLRHIDSAVSNSGNLQLILIAAGVSAPVWVMLTHPIPGLRREKLRFWLDAGAAMIAAAVFVWTFLVSHATGRGGTALLLSTVSAVVMLVSAFGVVKLVLSANAPFNRASALAGGLGAFLVGMGTGLQVPAEDTWASHLMLAGRLLPCVLFAACARLQERGLRAADTTVARPSRRRHSRLPYLAVVAAQLLMIVMFFRFGLPVRLAGVLVGVTLVIALVTARQLVTFADVDTLVSQLSGQEKRFRALVRYASDVTLVVDRDGLITYASPALLRVLGSSPETVVGSRAADGLHPDDLSAMRAAVVRSAVDPDNGVHWRARARHSDGSWRWLEIVSTNRLDDPSVGGIISNARDITGALDLEERLRRQASHDQLTGIANRLLFTERLDRIAREGAPGELAGMLAIDLNDFKPINDSFGHQAGDAVLVAVAGRLAACLRDTDTVARLGGDEFAVVVYPTTELEMQAVVDRVRTALAEPMRVAGHDLVVGASIGVSTGPAAAAGGLLELADAAMYESKRDTKASRKLTGFRAQDSSR